MGGTLVWVAAGRSILKKLVRQVVPTGAPTTLWKPSCCCCSAVRNLCSTAHGRSIWPHLPGAPPHTHTCE